MEQRIKTDKRTIFDLNEIIICENHAEIDSQWQEYGDRLYWIEDISSVEYEEIEKPKPKEKIKIIYNLELNKDQKLALEEYMKELFIKF